MVIGHPNSLTSDARLAPPYRRRQQGSERSGGLPKDEQLGHGKAKAQALVSGCEVYAGFTLPKAAPSSCTFSAPAKMGQSSAQSSIPGAAAAIGESD